MGLATCWPYLLIFVLAHSIIVIIACLSILSMTHNPNIWIATSHKIQQGHICLSTWWALVFKLGQCMFHNGTIQADLAAQCEYFNIEVEKMIHAVVTQWLTHGTVLNTFMNKTGSLNR